MSEATAPIQTHYRTCNICEAMCGIEIQYQANKIISIKGDKNDPLSQGHICPKAVALQDFYEDPDRLKKPLRKTDNGWEEMEWDEAIPYVANRIREIQEAHGNNALATFLGNPNAHNLGNNVFGPILIKALKTKNRFSASSLDQLPHHVASSHMFGHSLLTAVADIDRTDYIMVIGGNPMVSNGSMMTVPNFPKRLKALQERGGKMVVIDPRKTETAKRADAHHFIKPETDALFLAAIIHTIFEEDKVATGHLTPILKRLDEVREAVAPFSPERVAKQTGIRAEDIRQMAREMSEAEKAVCYSRMGASTQRFGGVNLWLTNVLNIITGNFDAEGGMMFSLPAFDHIMATSKKGKAPRKEGPKTRVSGLPYNIGEFPTAALAEEMETPGEGQIKALLVVAGNPVLSAPNGPRLEKAMEQLDFMVAIDIYKTETSRMADVILPVATGLQSSNYDVVFHALAVRNTAKYSPRLFERDEDQRYEWEVLKALHAAYTGIPDNGMTPEFALDNMLKMGPYGQTGLSLKKLKENPHGVDLGPLKPCLDQRLQTHDDLIDMAPELFVEDLQRLENTFLESPSKDEAYPFALIGRRVLRHHNTWTHNSDRLMRGRNQCTVQVNPEDAATLGLENGEKIEVSSRIGRVEIEAEITDEMMPGVVSIPQGWGSRKKTNMKVAASYGGVSINALTDDKRLDTLTGNAAFNGMEVKLAKL
ncbi:MAG: molybdopterin-dependent oxidoreductase [Bacteroidota bacterium]